MRAILIGFTVLLIAISVAHPESVFGGWSVSEEVQEIDDSILTLASLYEENRRAVLHIRCWRDEIEMFVQSFVGEFHEQNVQVRVRVDDNPPEDQVWNRSTDRTGAFYPDDGSDTFLELLLDFENPNKESRFLVRVPAGHTFTFNMKGLLWALMPVAYACGADL